MKKTYLSATPEYLAYRAAYRRCNHPQNQDFHNYGARGIKFLYASFDEFIADVGPRPAGHMLDRRDNDGHYALGNCRWVKRTVSNGNRRTWSPYQYKGIFKTSSGRYHAQIRHNGARICTPVVDTIEQAAHDYDAYIIANDLERTLNFPQLAELEVAA